jgi:hypothetical protein
VPRLVIGRVLGGYLAGIEVVCREAERGKGGGLKWERGSEREVSIFELVGRLVGPRVCSNFGGVSWMEFFVNVLFFLGNTLYRSVARV